MNEAIQWNELSAMPDDREYEIYHRCSSYWETAVFHAHEYYELYFYISGATEITLENYSIKMKPGDLLILPPGYMHRAVIHDRQARYERMYIYVDRRCLESMSSKDFNLLKIIESCVLHSHFSFSLPRDIFDSCIKQMECIISRSFEPSPAQQLINRCRFNMLLVTLCDALTKVDDTARESVTSRMNELILYIQSHISEPLSLDSLAEQFFVSKYHLLHEFKAYTSTSIYQYILSKRIIYSKILLQAGTAPGDAYSKCGFSDYSGFYKAFRKETGISPQQYVQRMNEPRES